MLTNFRTTFCTLALAIVTASAPTSWTSSAWAAEDDIVFAAALTADEQSAPTESPGSGYAEFRLERETLKLSWKIVYKDLTSPPTAAGLYGPENVGGNAGQIVDLAPKGLASPLQGSVILSDGNFQYLITSRVYVNILTTKYKDGELRGQLRRQRSKPPATN